MAGNSLVDAIMEGKVNLQWKKALSRLKIDKTLCHHAEGSARNILWWGISARSGARSPVMVQTSTHYRAQRQA
jgi:hypothetical protein